MRKFCAVGVSVIALGVAPAFSAGSRRELTTHVADYNAAQVKLAGDVVTVPDNFATYTVSDGTLELNSHFIVTLPEGFHFASQPSFRAPGQTVMVLIDGGIGAQSATFAVTGALLAAGPQSDGSLALNSFTVEHAAALEAPIPSESALPITMQSTDNTEPANNDPKPLFARGFASEPGAELAFDLPPVTSIDLTSPSLGALFGTRPADDTATILLATVRISTEFFDPTQSVPVLSPTGQPNHLSTADTATVTIRGLFNGIASAFTSADANCSTRLTAGTASSSQLIYPGLPIETPAALHLCVTASGTALLRQNPGGFRLTLSPGTSTDFLGARTVHSCLGGWTYTGGNMIELHNYLGYNETLLRVSNEGASASTIFARIQPDDDGAPLAGLLATVPAGSRTVFTEAMIATAVSGLDLHNSGQRATLQLVVSGDDPAAVMATGLLVNPGSGVDNTNDPAPVIEERCGDQK